MRFATWLAVGVSLLSIKSVSAADSIERAPSDAPIRRFESAGTGRELEADFELWSAEAQREADASFLSADVGADLAEIDRALSRVDGVIQELSRVSERYGGALRPSLIHGVFRRLKARRQILLSRRAAKGWDPKAEDAGAAAVLPEPRAGAESAPSAARLKRASDPLEWNPAQVSFELEGGLGRRGFTVMYRGTPVLSLGYDQAIGLEHPSPGKDVSYQAGYTKSEVQALFRRYALVLAQARALSKHVIFCLDGYDAFNPLGLLKVPGIESSRVLKAPAQEVDFRAERGFPYSYIAVFAYGREIGRLGYHWDYHLQKKEEPSDVQRLSYSYAELKKLAERYKRRLLEAEDLGQAVVLDFDRWDFEHPEKLLRF